MSKPTGGRKQPQGEDETTHPAAQQLRDLPIAEVQKQLSGSANGLSQADARKRLEQYGPNELPEKKQSPVLKFLSYFWGPIPAMIIVAAILSGILEDRRDFGVVLVLLSDKGWFLPADIETIARGSG